MRLRPESGAQRVAALRAERPPDAGEPRRGRARARQSRRRHAHPLGAGGRGVGGGIARAGRRRVRCARLARLPVPRAGDRDRPAGHAHLRHVSGFGQHGRRAVLSLAAAGSGSGATVSGRLLTRGGDTQTVGYNLYTSSAYTTAWGDGSGSSSTVAGACPRRPRPRPARTPTPSS
ncbi:spore coat protein U domain-containing protein [Ralstonia pseudosolanacearum]